MRYDALDPSLAPDVWRFHFIRLSSPAIRATPFLLRRELETGKYSRWRSLSSPVPQLLDWHSVNDVIMRGRGFADGRLRLLITIYNPSLHSCWTWYNPRTFNFRSCLNFLFFSIVTSWILISPSVTPDLSIKYNMSNESGTNKSHPSAKAPQKTVVRAA